VPCRDSYASSFLGGIDIDFSAKCQFLVRSCDLEAVIFKNKEEVLKNRECRLGGDSLGNVCESLQKVCAGNTEFHI
jgi:hypothetical protein